MGILFGKELSNSAELSNLPEIAGGGQVSINLGDATLLTSLLDLGQGNTSVVIDPTRQVFDLLQAELNEGKEVFTFLRTNDELATRYASILTRVIADPDMNEGMQALYQEVWKEAHKSSGSLVILPEKIETVLDEIDGSRLPIADRVTYHYPSVFEPLFSALELASKVLKPDGEFVMTTENSETFDAMLAYAGNMAERAEYIEREPESPYSSAYQMAWGQRGHYQVTVRNENDQLGKFVEFEKNQWLFRLQSWLGLIR